MLLEVIIAVLTAILRFSCICSSQKYVDLFYNCFQLSSWYFPTNFLYFLATYHFDLKPSLSAYYSIPLPSFNLFAWCSNNSFCSEILQLLKRCNSGWTQVTRRKKKRDKTEGKEKEQTKEGMEVHSQMPPSLIFPSPYDIVKSEPGASPEVPRQFNWLYPVNPYSEVNKCSQINQ